VNAQSVVTVARVAPVSTFARRDSTKTNTIEYSESSPYWEDDFYQMPIGYP
jgi:hypothetical protein